MDITENNSFAVIRMEWGTGGAPKVTERIARELEADLYYGYAVDDQKPSKDLDSTKLFGRNLLSGSPSYRELKSALSINKTGKLESYDVVIQSGNKCGWYVPPASQTVVRYVHSIPEIYDKNSKSKSTFSQIYSLAGRVAYHNTANFVDRYVCNSEFVERQVQKYLAIDSDRTSVVYPPIDEIEEFDHDNIKKDYYLFISRLEPDKRIEETMNAFTELTDLNLIVAGRGSEESKVKRYSEKYENIDYEGYVSEKRKKDLYSNAEAVIFPTRNEPFGMVPVESMMFGTPVVTVEEGFPQYIIKDTFNGVIADSTSSNGIKNAVRRIDNIELSLSESEIRRYAMEFSSDRFDDEIKNEIKYTVRNKNIESKTKRFLDKL